MPDGIRNKADLLLALLYAGESAADLQSAAQIVGITRLAKLLFLLKIEGKFLNNVAVENDFHFVPFRMGPWTHEVYDEVDFLESLGLLKKEGHDERSPADAAHDDELFSELVLDKYQKEAINVDDEVEVFSLTNEGKRKAVAIWNRLSDEEKKCLISIKMRFNRMNLRQLLRYIYKKYPTYTTESEIKNYLNL